MSSAVRGCYPGRRLDGKAVITGVGAALTDEQIDVVADALGHHPMLLGYSETDRLLISGALAIAAVRALDLPDVEARAERRERERLGRAYIMRRCGDPACPCCATFSDVLAGEDR